MKSKFYGIILTVFQIAIAALCFVQSWASVKWNMKMDMWGTLSFYELWIFMPEHVAGLIVMICAAAAVALTWTPLRPLSNLSALIQSAILIKSRYELTHDIWRKGTGYQEAQILPLGNFHCILVITILVIGIVMNAIQMMKNRKK